MKAIETRYAGCHFRSRLEARWAVYLNTLGIKWEYEPEGFELTWRLRLSDDLIYYLPDFYLPELNTYAEVKGSWTPGECDRFLNAAASLADPCGGPNVVVFGPIPEPSATWWPNILHFHKGDLAMGPWNPWVNHQCSWDGNLTDIARDVGGDDDDPDFPYREVDQSIYRLANSVLAGTHANYGTLRGEYAMTAARSARFEHGQSGPT